MYTAITQIKKRNNDIVDFNPEKIKLAIMHAFTATRGLPDDALCTAVADAVLADMAVQFVGKTPGVEDVQNLVERELMAKGMFDVAKSYIIYRYEHQKVREEKKQELLHKIETQGITILKRDGRKEIFDPEKLKKSLKKMITGYEDSINIEEVIAQVRLEIYEDMPTAEIERALIMVLRSFIERDPAYSFVAARALINKINKEIIGADKIDFDKDLDKQFRQSFVTSIKEGVAIGRLDPRLLTFDLEKIASQLVPERDNLLHYLAVQTLADRYFIKNTQTKQLLETPQIFWMRVAMGMALLEQNKEARALDFYHVISSLHFVPSSPTLFHSGTPRPQLSSCYLTTIEDSLDHIFKSIGDNAQLSKWAGGVANDWSNLRGTGATIQGTGVESQGVIPFLKIANDTTVAINRSGRRRGATCAYLETWHYDLEDFLELRKNTGDERRRTHDMNISNWIPDLFMKRVKEDGNWYLFSPEEVSDLHHIYGKAFEKRYNQYEAMAESGQIRLFKKLRAKDLWKKMLIMLFETGHPWVTFKDPSNIRSPQDHAGVVHSSNLCTEITLNTSAEETAVCNLGSVNLARHITKGKLELDRLQYTVSTAMRMLDNVIDINFYPTAEAKNSNLKHRPVGLGIMGFQDALYKLGINFDSEDCVQFADRSMEAVSYYAILASSQLAAERGQYASYRGSKWDRGIFPVDTIALHEQERGLPIDVDRKETMDWSVVRQSVKENGMRNSNCMAIAPTATISNISGAVPSIEPIYKNIYVKSNISGDFVVVNQALVEELKLQNLWNADMLAKLKFNDGRVSAIAEIPQAIKDKYKEVFEIDPKWLIRAAAYRGKWIDQSQSLNIFYAGKSGKEISDIYMYAWDIGLKTTYYLRTMAASQVEKSTVDTAAFGNTHIRSNVSGVDKVADSATAPAPMPVAEPAPMPVMAAASTAEPTLAAETVSETITTQSLSPLGDAISASVVEEKESVTIKVEPISFGVSGGVSVNPDGTASASQFKLCRLDDPECEACQ